jgi:hypothetical protein
MDERVSISAVLEIKITAREKGARLEKVTF